MSEKARPKHKSRKKDRVAAPPVDGMTVIWMSTFVTALMCEVAAFGILIAVGFESKALLAMLARYLLLAAALIGLFLIVLTPLVVRRARSNPPMAVVIAAYVVGALPWLAMIQRVAM
jgi:hypothetical protein